MMFRKLLMCVALVLGMLTVTVTATDITGDTADTGVYSNGDVGWAGGTSERVGGAKVASDPRGDECVIYVFQLPDPGGGEITAANMSFYFEGTSYYVPVGNADLYGIPYRSSSSVQSSDWYQGAYDGDPGATALQDNILTPSSSVGTINSDSSGDSALVAYLNAQYTAGAVAGDYVFIRVNADTDESNDPQRYWTISMTEHGTASQRPVLSVTTGAADTTPPSPDPMTWATVPYATGDSSISMTATTATDASGVEYYFDETSGNPGGADSGWQDSTTYEDTGLSPGTTYSYQVKARDKSANQNETAYSTTESATTDAADTTPPSPDPMTWATVPYSTGSSSISMTATTATDDSGVEYYFDCTTSGGHDSGWQDSATYQDTGLSPETQYSYQVKARDKSVNQNETAYSTLESATTDPAGAGNTFYCDPVSGSMANDGSSGSPWSTIEAVFDNNKIESRDRNLVPKNVGAPVKAGDTIKLRSGNHGSLYETDYCNTAHITIEADTGHEPKLTSVEFRYSFNWTFRGLTVTNGQGPTGYLMQFRYDCHDITVEDCYVYSEEDSSGWSEAQWNSVSSGLWLSGTDCLASNNTILNIDMGILTSGSGTQIIGNVIQNFAKDGIRGSGDNITLEDNDILDCYNVNTNHDDAVQWYSGAGGTAANVIIRGMYVNDDTSGGTRNFIGGSQGLCSFDDTISNWTVENNLVLVNHWHGISLYNADNCTTANNTAYNAKFIAGTSEMTTWISFTNPGSGNKLVNNLMHSSTSGYNQQVTTSNYTSYFVNTDPANLDLHLKDGSPAIDAGTPDGAPSVDFDGNPRPSGDGYDVGAYEYDSGGVGNISPVADAGPDQTVVDSDENASETVTLDGSGSYDPDGTIESYVWKEDGSQIATGVNPSVAFDVNYHEVTLEVTDNNNATGTDTVIIIVNTPTAVTSTTAWQNFTIANQTGSFTFEFDTRPNRNSMDGIIGLSQGDAAAYSDLACIFRFNTSGNMDVRNGGSYGADVTLPYSAGDNFHVRMEVDISSHTYDVYVTPEGQSEVTLATNYAFRTEQASVTSLDRWVLKCESGSHMVDNAEVGGGAPATVMYVNDITMSYKKMGSQYAGKATVWIKDEDTYDVEGATVYGNWSDAVSEPDQGTTGSDGKVTLQSSKVDGGGTFTFTVTNVTKDDYTYDPNQNIETWDSITVP